MIYSNTLLSQCGNKIKVVALTAIRSEYDLLYPLLKNLNMDSKFDVSIIVAGAHLTELHNYSYKLIEADGFKIVGKIHNFKNTICDNKTVGRVQSAGFLLNRIAPILKESNPDLFIYLGDREEALIAAIAANYMGIPSIHIAGGDNAHPVGGDVDEEARHATTKLSHIHLTMAKAHEVRIKKMGEETWRIKTVGNPGLDRLRTEPSIDICKVYRKLGVKNCDQYVVLIYHAVSSGVSVAPSEFELCIHEALATGVHVFVGSPNSDPGYIDLIKVINKFSKHPKVHVYSNLPRSEFVALLKNAKAIIGNSSLGILEASFIGLPSVNVGQRQRGRIAGVNVQFVDANSIEVSLALNKALFDAKYRKKVRKAKSPYGDGNMVKRSIAFIKNLPEKGKLLDKIITY